MVNKHLFYLQPKTIHNNMKKILLIALTAIVAVACSKEEVKEVVSNTITSTGPMTAKINGEDFSLPYAQYSVVDNATSHFVAVYGFTLTSSSITVNIPITSTGELAVVEGDVSCTRSYNSSEFGYSFYGSAAITAWDTINNVMSGTFSFDYVYDGDTIKVTEGKFTNIEEQ